MKQVISFAIIICTLTTSAPAQTDKFKTQTAVALPVKDYGKVYNVPFAGMMATIVRSLGHQLMPVKYCIDVPQSSTRASILFSISRRCALAIRPSLSLMVMGSASADNNGNAISFCAGVKELSPETRPVAAAVAERLINALLFNVMVIRFDV